MRFTVFLAKTLFHVEQNMRRPNLPEKLGSPRATLWIKKGKVCDECWCPLLLDFLRRCWKIKRKPLKRPLKFWIVFLRACTARRPEKQLRHDCILFFIYQNVSQNTPKKALDGLQKERVMQGATPHEGVSASLQLSLSWMEEFWCHPMSVSRLGANARDSRRALTDGNGMNFKILMAFGATDCLSQFSDFLPFNSDCF